MASCTVVLENIALELCFSFLRAGLVEETEEVTGVGTIVLVGESSPYQIGEESGLNQELFVETADLGNADIIVTNAKFGSEQVAC